MKYFESIYLDFIILQNTPSPQLGLKYDVKTCTVCEIFTVSTKCCLLSMRLVTVIKNQRTKAVECTYRPIVHLKQLR